MKTIRCGKRIRTKSGKAVFGTVVGVSAQIVSMRTMITYLIKWDRSYTSWIFADQISEV